MSDNVKISIIAVGVYIWAAFLTGAYYSNHRLTCGEHPQLKTQMCDTDIAVISGVFWPAYWLGRFSLRVTK